MPDLFSRVFWQSTAETTVSCSAATTLGVLIMHAADLLKDVPWYAVLSAAGLGGLIGLCKSLSSLKVQPCNGTDSYNPRVVAEPKP